MAPSAAGKSEIWRATIAGRAYRNGISDIIWNRFANRYEPMNRRAFLQAVFIAGTAARTIRAAWPRIKLSLSGRISEPIGQVTDLKPLTYDEFLQVAKSTGYDAICLRPLQCNISTPLEEMIEMARKTREAGLKVSK